MFKCASGAMEAPQYTDKAKTCLARCPDCLPTKGKGKGNGKGKSKIAIGGDGV